MIFPSEGEDSSTARSQAWSDYWREGPLHSLQGSYPRNYEGEIGAFWSTVFSGLDASRRVLDVGTGNGPLPAMLCERKLSLLPRIDAIDLASISPAWLECASAECRNAVRFHSHTSVECLPFPDLAYDLVISQFGLEYANLELAIPEIARVLRSGGSLAFVAHHADSRIAAIAAEEVSVVGWLLSENAVIAAVNNLLPYLAIAAGGGGADLAGDSRANACRSTFNAAMRKLEERSTSDRYPDLLLYVRERIGILIDATLRRQLAQSTAESEIESLRRELAAGAFRSAELIRHALDENGLVMVANLLQTHGFEVPEIRRVNHGTLLLGAQIRALKI